ncbi:MAG: hypothetical protein ABSE41_05155 [Bacteroidota bacterium]|jgi:hypothetical protein
MLLVRAALFTILVPGTVGGFLPYVIAQRWPEQFDSGIVRPLGLLLIAVALGEALWFWAVALCLYTIVLWIFFHCVVLFVEEPHLRIRHGEEYSTYCSIVPRWFGFPKMPPDHTQSMSIPAFASRTIDGCPV